MSSTNKTTYYNLSQFTNTDKPSWLNDYNNDMTIIDTNLKANANDISTNTTNINTNTNSIGDLTNLTTTAKNNLVSAINEVASSSGGGSSLSKWELTTFDTYDATNYATKGVTTTGNVLSINAMSITIDTNSDNSIYSIYGTMTIVSNNTSAISVTFPTTLNTTTSQEYKFTGLNISRLTSTPHVYTLIGSDGKLTIKFFPQSGDNFILSLNIPRVVNFS